MDILGGSLQDIRRDRLCNGHVSKAPSVSLRHRDGFPLLPPSLVSSCSQAVAALGTSLLAKLPVRNCPRGLFCTFPVFSSNWTDTCLLHPSPTETSALEEPTQAGPKGRREPTAHRAPKTQSIPPAPVLAPLPPFRGAGWFSLGEGMEAGKSRGEKGRQAQTQRDSAKAGLSYLGTGPDMDQQPLFPAPGLSSPQSRVPLPLEGWQGQGVERQGVGWKDGSWGWRGRSRLAAKVAPPSFGSPQL